VNFYHSVLHALVALLFSACVLGAEPALAQASYPAGTDQESVAGQPSSLPENLSREAIRDVLSGLDDAQVRERLLRELDEQAAERAAALAGETQRSALDVAEDWGADLGTYWLQAVTSVPELPAAISETAEVFDERRGEASLWQFFLGILAAVAGGFALATVVHRLVRRWEARIAGTAPEGLGERIKILVFRFGLETARLIAFLIGAFLINRVMNSDVPADFMTGKFIIQAIGVTWFAALVANFILAPGRPQLRLCSVSDEAARFLTNRITLIFAWSAVGPGLYIWFGVFGMPVEIRFGFWVALVFYGLMALTLWQARDAITGILLGEGESSAGWRRFSHAWPRIAIGLVVANFLVVQLLAATNTPINLNALDATLVAILALPLLELVLPAVVTAAWPTDPDDDLGRQAAHRMTQAGLVRVARIPVLILVIVGLASMWGLNLQDLASQGVGAQFAGALIQVIVIAIIAYGLWEMMNIVADRQIAIDRIAQGGEEEQENEGEGGMGGTRLGTLMPLIRGTARFFIVLLAGLAILGQLGINITPLLAGAGVLGLAIGFGAQTLVRDVLSGLFFLIDDAFRKGEYIDLRDVKGTVESISIRSMKLRHHNGPLHTIPFGEIKYLTNFSRDWVMMKLPLRVTYDTDVERLRKLVKKLCQEMLADPELGPKFLQPLKSQGVIQMEDSAMIVRVKFMTRPGDQWTLRNKVFARLRELFEQEGIKFAHREVTVRIADDIHPGQDGEIPLAHHTRREAAATGAVRAALDDEAAKASQPSLAETR